MPEGDTIAKLAQRIDAAVGGEMVTSTVTRDPRLVGVTFDGQRLVDAVAVGKFLLLRFDSGATLYSHLQMDGEWKVGRRPRIPEWRRRAELTFPDAVLTAVDMPDIGIVDTDREVDVIGHLGPNLCGPSAPPPQLVADQLQAAPSVPLAAALLDQRRVAGFGNVFAVELPFLAGIAPFAPVERLAGLDRLATAGVALIRWSASGHPRNTTGRQLARADHYLYGATTTGAGTPVEGNFQLTNSRCRVCGERVTFAADDATEWRRASWWCPTCQPTDRVDVDDARIRRLLALHPGLRRTSPNA